jgi:hypothetical protein
MHSQSLHACWVLCACRHTLAPAAVAPLADAHLSDACEVLSFAYVESLLSEHASAISTRTHCYAWCCRLQNRWRKRGLAVTPTKFGIAFTKLTYNQGGALVHVYTDGTVSSLVPATAVFVTV